MSKKENKKCPPVYMNWVWISQISKFMILHSNAVLRTLAPLESLNSSIWEIWKKSTLWQDKINFCYNFLFFRKNHKNYLHSNNQYAIIRFVIHNSSQTKCPDSSVGRAEDWKSSCRWFDSGSGHLVCELLCITNLIIAYWLFECK